jgi:hypothetical protein
MFNSKKEWVEAQELVKIARKIHSMEKHQLIELMMSDFEPVRKSAVEFHEKIKQKELFSKRLEEIIKNEYNRRNSKKLE